MAIPVQNLKFREGEAWRIVFTAHDSDDNELPLPDGSDVQFRINGVVDGVATNLMTLMVSNGVIITSPEHGAAQIDISLDAQTQAGIKTGGIYFYEVFVSLPGEEPAAQIEGQLLVERSLFAAAVDPLLEQFQARFPEFSEDDTIISLLIGDAREVVNKDTSWSAKDKTLAILYLAAHLTQMRKASFEQYQTTGGILTTGAVQSIRTEDRMVMFDRNSQSRSAIASKTGLAQTLYGQQYLSLLRQQVHFFKRA